MKRKQSAIKRYANVFTPFSNTLVRLNTRQLRERLKRLNKKLRVLLH